MKKITLTLVVILATFNFCFGQANFFTEAPQGVTTTQVRAPNGLAAYAYLRACALVLQSELTNIPNNTSISLFGFTLATTSTVTIPVTGNFTVYLQNTSDVTYQKGTNWGTIPTGMSQAYASVMTIPLSSTSTSIVLTLSTPFVYTGGGIYVAYDWDSAGPFSTAPATYYAEGTALTPGCASGNSASSAPTTLGTTAFRPNFLFGYANPYTNDIQVVGLQSPGNIASLLNNPHSISALIKNSGGANQTNISVNLNITGANPFTANHVIPALTAGSTTLITFPATNPSNPGIQTVSVSVASDQNNVNNSKTYPQNVNCNIWSLNPAAGNFTSTSVGFGAGSGILVTQFLTPGSSTLAGIRGAIGTDVATPGNNIYGALLSSTGVVLATTNTITITSAMLNTFQQFNFSTPQNLTAATPYYFGLAQIASPSAIAYYPAGTQNIGYQPSNLYFSTPLAGGALTALAQDFGYFGLEAVLSHSYNVAVASTPSAICMGTCSTLNAVGEGTLTWSNSSTGTSITICPTITSTYSVSNTTSLGCTSSAMITLTVNPIPNVTAISTKTAVCVGNSVTLTANGASTYAWDLGATTNTMSDAPPVTTIYTVTGTSAFGCSKTNTVQVVVNTFTPGISSPTAICQGGQTSLQATGGAGNSYTWSTNFIGFPTIPSLSPTVTTVYSVTSIDANGCIGSNSTTVTVNSNPTVSAVAQRTAMCKGETNTITASGAPTYSWSTNSTNTTIVVTPSISIQTIYTVTGIDPATGCSNAIQISFKVNDCTGLAEFGGKENTISIFPNPNTGNFNVYLESFDASYSIKVYNALGSLIQEQKVDSKNTAVDIEGQTKGLYFVHVYKGNKPVEVSKIIKN